MKALVPVLLLLACAPALPPLDRARFDALQPGVATIADARAAFGTPFAETVDGEGRTSLTWIGRAGSGRAQSVVLTFGPDGRLTSDRNAFTEAGR